jgi:hypothetical protein
MMLNVVATLLGLILIALVFIARDLRVLARARAYDSRRNGMRESVIGFGPTAIPAGESAIFSVSPSSEYDGTRLIVPSSLANNFVIDDIVVGTEPQAISANGIPAAAFSELAVGVNLGLKTAKKDVALRLKVSNTTKSSQTFCAALIGYVAKDAKLGASARATLEATGAPLV